MRASSSQPTFCSFTCSLKKIWLNNRLASSFMVGAPCPWEISDQPLYIQICFLTQQACPGMRSDSNLASIYSKEENYWIEQKMEVNTHLPNPRKLLDRVEIRWWLFSYRIYFNWSGCVIIIWVQICLWSFTIILFNRSHLFASHLALKPVHSQVVKIFLVCAESFSHLCQISAFERKRKV